MRFIRVYYSKRSASNYTSPFAVATKVQTDPVQGARRRPLQQDPSRLYFRHATLQKTLEKEPWHCMYPILPGHSITCAWGSPGRQPSTIKRAASHYKPRSQTTSGEPEVAYIYTLQAFFFVVEPPW